MYNFYILFILAHLYQLYHFEVKKAFRFRNYLLYKSNIYKYIYNHQGMASVQNSLILYHYLSQSAISLGESSVQHPVSIQS